MILEMQEIFLIGSFFLRCPSVKRMCLYCLLNYDPIFCYIKNRIEITVETVQYDILQEIFLSFPVLWD